MGKLRPRIEEQGVVSVGLQHHHFPLPQLGVEHIVQAHQVSGLAARGSVVDELDGQLGAFVVEFRHGQ